MGNLQCHVAHIGSQRVAHLDVAVAFQVGCQSDGIAVTIHHLIERHHTVFVGFVGHVVELDGLDILLCVRLQFLYRLYNLTDKLVGRKALVLRHTRRLYLLACFFIVLLAQKVADVCKFISHNNLL